MPRPNKPRYIESRDAWVSRIGGRQHTLAKGKKNRRAAERELNRLLDARDAGKVMTGPKDMALWALFDHFMDAKKPTTAPLTYLFYRRHLRSFLAFVGRNRLASTVTPEDVQGWLDAPKTLTRRCRDGETRTFTLPPWGPATRHGAIVAVKAPFNWAVKREHLARNPIREKKGDGIGQRQAVLDRERVFRILAATRGPFRDLLEFMWETGCRPSEAMDLEARHVRFAEGVVRMRSKTSRKTGKDRVIYLTDRAIEILRRWTARHPDGFVFRSQRGRQWQRHAMAQRFARIREELGMGPEATAEAIRHAFGTDGALRLKPLVLAELMGHTDVSMVAKYYAHLGERKDEMMEALRTVRPGTEP